VKTLLRRLVKFVAYMAGGVVILLAIAVGLFRLLLPRLPEYQEDIKSWASAAIGMTVEFSGMDARWGLSGPEVEFYDAELLSADDARRFIAADKVSVGVGLLRLLTDRKFVVDRVSVSDTAIEIRQLDNGEFWVQGSPVDELLPRREGGGAGAGGGDVGRIELVGEDIDILFLQPGDERPRRFRVTSVIADRDEQRIAVKATVDLPDDLGNRLTVDATRLLGEDPADSVWDVTVDIDDIDLAGVSSMQPAEAARFDAGHGDVELSLAIAGGRITNAAALLAIDDIAIAGLADVAVSGRIEYIRDDGGWLVAANEFRARTPTGEWPESSLRFEASTNDEGRIVMIDARASYLDFSHLPVVEPWLNDEQRRLLAEFDPSGIVRDLAFVAGDFDADVPDFDLSVRFEDLGFAARGKQPGVRGVTGSLRADNSGGLLEIDSDDLVVSAPTALGEPLGMDVARGTVIWRQSRQGITVLSDSIVLGNAYFDSQTSVEVVVGDDWRTPVVDLNSSFSISNVAEARKHVPFMPKRPRMSQWFQEGLVSGRIENGHLRLSGPMDRFPFEGDEGLFLVEGTIRDAVIIYQPKWPAAEIVEADLVVENRSLRSERSRIFNAGNEIVDAKLEIANFRQPVMTISALATGTLESLRQLCLQSPIAEMFGGQLERISVSGDATASLDLRVPIRDWQSFSFTTRVQTGNGSFLYDGFPAPLTDLSGTVQIERENIASEALGGRLLGNPVFIDLEQAPESMPGFRVIANARGAATADALEQDLGLPMQGRASGETEFAARLLFPRGNVENPEPFTIQLASDLQGFVVDLPRPLGKSAAETVDVAATMTVRKGGERIETEGRAGDILSWDVDFEKGQAWDLDRGVISFGTEPVDEDAETRGLHLRGRSDYVHAQKWFDLSRESGGKTGIGERIRSIDMTIDNLHVIGQHLVGHHVRLDRGANEWIVGIDGDHVVASVSVPYDFNSGQPIVVDAERLLLPGDDESDEKSNVVDPRSLPPISLKAGELAFGNRHMGAVEAEFQRTADGLVGDGIVARDSTFEIVANARWVIDETDPLGHRSAITATLTSTDVAKTMRRLDYDPGIDSDELSMLLDISWSGGPSEQMLESLDGNVKVQIGAGQLAEVKPGAGRVFGLMSIAALPRRLDLDFRDVFGKGFGFDEIKGDFRIVDGETYTCNLALQGPAADIGIVGRAGLVSREYEQAAVVSANFGNALPVAGALVAGPQVAAALLIISRIFRKPLQEVSQVYYTIGGTFDEPVIERTTADIFALSGTMVGCIEEPE